MPCCWARATKSLGISNALRVPVTKERRVIFIETKDQMVIVNCWYFADAGHAGILPFRRHVGCWSFNEPSHYSFVEGEPWFGKVPVRWGSFRIVFRHPLLARQAPLKNASHHALLAARQRRALLQLLPSSRARRMRVCRAIVERCSLPGCPSSKARRFIAPRAACVSPPVSSSNTPGTPPAASDLSENHRSLTICTCLHRTSSLSTHREHGSRRRDRAPPPRVAAE